MSVLVYVLTVLVLVVTIAGVRSLYGLAKQERDAEPDVMPIARARAHR